VAAALIESGDLQSAVQARYADWDGELGRNILEGKVDLEALWARARDRNGSPRPASGRQELLENRVRRIVERA
jgi:xylose isomerase